MKTRVLDTVSVSYESMDELIERESIIIDKLNKYILEKGIADSYQSRIVTTEDGRYLLTIDILITSYDVED